MENNFVKNFNINTLKKNFEDIPKINLNDEVYLEAEKMVRDKIISGKKEIDANNYDEMLMKCILGDIRSIIQIKELIKKYLIEVNKYTEEQIKIFTENIYVYNFGLSVIDDLVKDETINEIWVNGANQIWIEKNGVKKRLDRKFRNDEEVLRVMSQMLQYDKKQINKSNPAVESKLLDGSRITFTIPPVSSYPCMNIRKFKAFDVTEENILKTKTIDKRQLEKLKLLIKGRSNILIIGETGSGKTSFLKLLYDYVNPNLRIGTIESNFELKLAEKFPNRNIFEYEEHQELGVTLGDLFKLCLRSSPDIIFLGEARGSQEAEALINSMRRGHPGSIGTIHTNNAETAIDDLVEMILEDGEKKRDPMLVKNRVVNAVDIIIQIHKFGNGKRKIARITEVVPMAESEYTGKYKLNDICEYDEIKDEFIDKGFIEGDSLKKKMKFFGVSQEEIKDYEIKWSF